MKPRTSLNVALLVIITVIGAIAKDDVYAPLPEKVNIAKTVFLVNNSGTAKLGDAVYRELKQWSRWQVVTDREKADLIFVVSPSDSIPVVVSTASVSSSAQTTQASGIAATGRMETQHWHLYVMDPKTGHSLWKSDASMGGKLWRTWNSIAKSMVTDIRKRIH